jgi:hypothetical protein
MDLGENATEKNIWKKTSLKRPKLILLLKELMYDQQLIIQDNVVSHIILLTKAGEKWLDLPDEEPAETISEET